MLLFFFLFSLQINFAVESDRKDTEKNPHTQIYLHFASKITSFSISIFEKAKSFLPKSLIDAPI